MTAQVIVTAHHVTKLGARPPAVLDAVLLSAVSQRRLCRVIDCATWMLDRRRRIERMLVIMHGFWQHHLGGVLGRFGSWRKRRDVGIRARGHQR